MFEGMGARRISNFFRNSGSGNYVAGFRGGFRTLGVLFTVISYSSSFLSFSFLFGYSFLFLSLTKNKRYGIYAHVFVKFSYSFLHIKNDFYFVQ